MLKELAIIHVVDSILSYGSLTDTWQAYNVHKPVVKDRVDYLKDFNLPAFQVLYFRWYLFEPRLIVEKN